MSVYLDTSAIVAALVVESHSARIRGWLSERTESGLFISEWTITEIASALAGKLRMGAIPPEGRAAALAAFQSLRDDSLAVDPVTPAHFEAAARFCDRHELGLRAGDALHLAVAAAAGHRVLTLDAAMAAACPELGIPVLEL